MTAWSEERLTEAARFHDYRYASNPIADGTLGGVPAATWGAELHERGPTRILPLDSGATLGVVGPATTPGLCANFVHVRPSEAIATEAAATTHLFFATRGAGATRLADGTEFAWHSGDLFILPAGGPAVHDAAEDAALSWVHDEPLLRYLGVVPRQVRFISRSPSTSWSTASRAATPWSAARSMRKDGWPTGSGSTGTRTRCSSRRRDCGTLTTTSPDTRLTSFRSRMPACTPTCGHSTSGSPAGTTAGEVIWWNTRAEQRFRPLS